MGKLCSEIVIMLLVVCIPNEAMVTKLGNKTLQMVHLVYRHGHRSPITFYPNDPYPPSIWPDGPGRLTQLGMNLEFGLGKFLRERYVTNFSFIDSMYLHKQVYIRSSNVDRCLQSAEAQLAALYPPQGRQIWNRDIKWQPVPVHTVPEDEDEVLRAFQQPCPRRDKIQELKKKTLIYKKKVQESQKLVDFVSNKTGMSLDLDNFWKPVDTLISEKTKGFKLPDWATLHWEEIKALNDWTFLWQFTGNNELRRLVGGPLLRNIRSNMKMWSEGKRENLYSLNIFSGHDTSVLSLLSALEINVQTAPPFAACILVEMYSRERDYYVEIRYRNDSSGVSYPLKIPNCDFSCPLQDFLKFTEARTSVDRHRECGLGIISKVKKIIKMPAVKVAALILGVILITFFAVVIGLAIRRRGRALSFRKTEYHRDGLCVKTVETTNILLRNELSDFNESDQSD